MPRQLPTEVVVVVVVRGLITGRARKRRVLLLFFFLVASSPCCRRFSPPAPRKRLTSARSRGASTTPPSRHFFLRALLLLPSSQSAPPASPPPAGRSVSSSPVTASRVSAGAHSSRRRPLSPGIPRYSGIPAPRVVCLLSGRNVRDTALHKQASRPGPSCGRCHTSSSSGCSAQPPLPPLESPSIPRVRLLSLPLPSSAVVALPADAMAPDADATRGAQRMNTLAAETPPAGPTPTPGRAGSWAA